MKKTMTICVLIFAFITILETSVFAKYENDTWDNFYDNFIEEYENNNGAGLSEEDLQRMIKGPKPMENKLDEGATKTEGGSLADWAMKAQGLLTTREMVKEKQNEDPKPGADSAITGKDDKEAKKLNEEIMKKYNSKDYNTEKMTQEEIETWVNKIQDYAISLGSTTEVPENIKAMYSELLSEYENKTGKKLKSMYDTQPSYIYKQPDKITDNSDMLTGDGIDKIVEGADEFTSVGTNNMITSGEMQLTFSFIYNIFFQIGVGLSVIIGLVLGIKFILSGIEEKAEVKKMLGVYVIACIVIFGSFGIWKLVLNIFESI